MHGYRIFISTSPRHNPFVRIFYIHISYTPTFWNLNCLVDLVLDTNNKCYKCSILPNPQKGLYNMRVYGLERLCHCNHMLITINKTLMMNWTVTTPKKNGIILWYQHLNTMAFCWRPHQFFYNVEVLGVVFKSSWTFLTFKRNKSMQPSFSTYASEK